MSGSPEGVRARRSAEEVRALLLEAARELFAERGFARTSTREVAKRANAAEVLVYRYFGSKAGLFEEAVSEPFDQLIEELRSTWLETHEELGGVSYGREAARRIYRKLRDDRRLILALISVRAYESSAESGKEPPEALRRFFNVTAEHLSEYFGSQGRDPGAPPEMMSRLAFATVFGAALLHDWLFAGEGDGPDVEDAVVEFEARALYSSGLIGERDGEH